MPKRILLTGAGGFIGAHCLEYFLNYTDWEIFCIDSFRHMGDMTRIADLFNRVNLEAYRERCSLHYHDLANPITPQLENLLLQRRFDGGRIVEKKFDYIINMASDSAVERSTQDPVSCLRNNYDLTINMLELARRIQPKIFFQISTDEVYGEAQPGQSHHEWDTIMPSNPYAASKAAQEAVAIAYWRTYDVPVVITNTMNNVGEWQNPEKFLPRIIQLVSQDKEVSIYGEPGSIGSRCYLHAKNHADALVFLSKQPVARYTAGAERPDRYNICGDVELNNLEMAQLVAKIMGKELKYKFVPSESARKGYDKRYALDGGKLRQMGWVAPMLFEESVEAVVRWTLAHPHWLI